LEFDMKKNSNTELFAYSVLCHQNGNIAEAKRGYKEILKNQPLHSDALHLLGVISAQEGKIDNALSLLGKALKIKGDHPFYLSDYANISMKKGNLIEAVVY
jgi:protein O-GlcNAc transferase